MRWCRNSWTWNWTRHISQSSLRYERWWRMNLKIIQSSNPDCVLHMHTLLPTIFISTLLVREFNEKHEIRKKGILNILWTSRSQHRKWRRTVECAVSCSQATYHLILPPPLFAWSRAFFPGDSQILIQPKILNTVWIRLRTQLSMRVGYVMRKCVNAQRSENVQLQPFAVAGAVRHLHSLFPGKFRKG